MLSFRLDQEEGWLKTQSLTSKVLTKSNQNIQKLDTYDLVNFNELYE